MPDLVENLYLGEKGKGRVRGVNKLDEGGGGLLHNSREGSLGKRPRDRVGTLTRPGETEFTLPSGEQHGQKDRGLQRGVPT